jgi:hypothetical protein
LNNTGDNVDIDINLPPGGSCMFEMRAQCGLPSFKPNNTDGLDIQYLQFDDEDGEPVDAPPQGSRLLQ